MTVEEETSLAFGRERTEVSTDDDGVVLGRIVDLDEVIGYFRPFALHKFLISYFVSGSRSKPVDNPDSLAIRYQIVQELAVLLSYVQLGQFRDTHPTYDGYHRVRRPTITKSERMRIFKERGSKCEVCGCKPNTFELHHLQYDNENDPESLVVVCKKCHDAINVMTGLVNWYEEFKKETETQIPDNL